MLKRKSFFAVWLFLTAALFASGGEVSFQIDTTSEQQPISPLIYGTNQEMSGDENLTAGRFGGNRTTGYNWENNASNAGSDWLHISDDYLCSISGIPQSDYALPGAVMTKFHDDNLAKGRYSLITLQAAGYVSRDKNGAVTEQETAPSIRWDEVFFEKGRPFSLTPDLNDGAVYMDELVNFLKTRYGSASTATGVKAYSIDNEPALWSHTHSRIHPAPAGAEELVTRTINLSRAVKNVDPSAEIYGPALYGFGAFNDLQSAPDWNSVKGSYSWYIDYYLDKIKTASAQQNIRLLDVLDVHWYPEAQGGGVRITEDNITQVVAEARMQAPRSLWDDSYIEDSWIGQWFQNYLPLIPKLKDSVNKYYPGTKVAITEYNYGAGSHISGGIAQADVLGIFGKYGLYMATLWKLGSETDYTSSAFKLFRNYDGNNSTYGDTSIKALTSNSAETSVYASTGDNQTLHIIALNKSYTNNQTASITIAGSKTYTSAQVWGFDSSAPALRQMASVPVISNNSFSYAIPPLTAIHMVLTTGSVLLLGDVNSDGAVTIVDALMTAQYYVGLNPPNYNPEAGDVNKDGTITIIDALMIAQYYVGLITTF